MLVHCGRCWDLYWTAARVALLVLACALGLLDQPTVLCAVGLGLYYLSNTAFTTLVQLWLRKLGGADVQINELGPITKVGTGEECERSAACGQER